VGVNACLYVVTSVSHLQPYSVSDTVCIFTQRGVMSSYYSLGASPIWDNPLFQDAFLDPMMYPIDIRNFPALDVDSANARLKLGLEFMNTMLRRAVDTKIHEFCSDYTPSEVMALNSLKDLLDQATLFLTYKPGDQNDPDAVKKLMTHLQLLVSKVASLDDGGVLIVPVATMCLFLIIQRRGSELFVVVVNSALMRRGVGYHPWTVRTKTGEAELPEIQFKPSLSIGLVPIARLTNSWFWYVLFRNPLPELYHDDYLGDQERTFYEILVPYLNGKTLGETIDSNYDHPIPTFLEAKDAESFDGFNSPKVGGDYSFVGTMFELVSTALLLKRCSPGIVDHFRVVLLIEICDSCKSDALKSPKLAPSTLRKIKMATQVVATAASRNATKYGTMTCAELVRVQTFIKDIITSVQPLLDSKNQLAAPLFPEDLSTVQHEPFILFDRFRRVESVEGLAGPTELAPFLRPVQFTLVPESVSNYFEVSNALRHCDHICTLLANQKDHIKNSYILRAALIQHVFTKVLPVPLPRDHPQLKCCLWRQAVRYETQVDVLRNLCLLSRHYSAACLSLKVTQSFDAARILTMACMATVADAVIRQKACDIPSVFSMHLNATAPPTPKFFQRPFGFDMGPFAVQSEFMLLTSPELVSARTKVLDYFQAQSKHVPPDHMIFNFESSTQLGALEQLLDQVCWEMGFPAENFGEYVSGELSEIIDNYPELEYYRDIVFLFKMLMSPTTAQLPEIKPWKPFDAKLEWSFKRDSGFTIRGFGKQLKIVIPELEEEGKKNESRRMSSGFLSVIRNKFRSVRTGPGLADPSALCGKEIFDEEDILHIKTLPDFDGRLSQRASELLLSYLTVPYLRIPLIMNFFCRGKNIEALANEKLQGIVEGVLFEPEQFQPAGVYDEAKINFADLQIPLADRHFFSSPCGLLFNELLKSPEGLLNSVLKMIDLILEYDTGRYSSENSGMILFVIRIIVRIEGWIRYIVENYEWRVQLSLDEKVSGSGAKSYIRGLECSEEHYHLLKGHRRTLRMILNRDVFGLLEAWAESAIKAGELSIACVIFAHTAFLYIHLPAEEFNARIVTTLISSNIFLTSRYSFNLAAEEGEKLKRNNKEDIQVTLGIPDTEVFQLFQRLRGPILQWLERNTDQASIVMEAVLRVVTMSSPGAGTDALDLIVSQNMKSRARRKSSLVNVSNFQKLLNEHIQEQSSVAQNQILQILHHAGDDEDDEDFDEELLQSGDANEEGEIVTHEENDSEEETLFKSRFWRHMDGRHCIGRYIPDLKLRTVEEKEAVERDRDMTRGHPEVETEINIQMGTLTLKTAVLEPLDERIRSMQDFVRAFGKSAKSKQFQTADVKSSLNRKWIRLVGRRHDIMLWNPDTRPFQLFPYAKPLNEASSSENWILDILQQYSSMPIMSDMKWHLLSKSSMRDDVAFLGALIYKKIIPEETNVKKRKDKDDEKKEDEVILQVVGLRELVIFRRTRLLQVFNVVEHGRRFYRTLIFSSDSSWSMENLPKLPQTVCSAQASQNAFPIGFDFTNIDPDEKEDYYEYVARPRPTLVILRNLGVSEEETQMFIPHRFLKGLLPAALLDQYDFWQNQDDSIFGYPKAALQRQSQFSEESSYIIQITFLDSSVVSPDSGVVISRIKNVVIQDEKTPEQKDENPKKRLIRMTSSSAQTISNADSSSALYLLNLQAAKPNSVLSNLADYLQRIEDLSYILVWTRNAINSLGQECGVDVIEMPRLNLKFVHAKGRLFSTDHVGMFLTNKRNDLVNRILRGLPHALLLEGLEGEMAVLLPAQLPVERDGEFEDCENRGIVFDRRDTQWLSKLDQRHYYYPIHLSSSFVFATTLASSLYLLMLRFLSQDFKEVFQLADSCVSDTTLSSEELHLTRRMTGLKMISANMHPDAHACRLKLLLSTSESGVDGLKFPWDFDTEMTAYIRKHAFVSSFCKFSLAEEHILLSLSNTDSMEMMNRKSLIAAILAGSPTMRAAVPDRTSLNNEFDVLVDQSVFDSLLEGFLKKLSRVSYKRPQEVTGEELLVEMSKWMRNGLRVKGGKDDLGFLFFYELMTGTLALKLLPSDSSYELGRLFTRMVKPKEFLEKSFNMSILRILDSNYALANSEKIPKVVDKKGLFKTMFMGLDNAYSKLIKSFTTWLQEHKEEIVWPNVYSRNPKYERDTVTIENPALQSLPRSCVAPRVLNYSCKSRQLSPIPPVNKLGLSPADIKAFATSPLIPLNLDLYVASRPNDGKSVPSRLPFDVSRHAAAQPPLAKSSLSRYETDLSGYSAQENESQISEIKGLNSNDIRQILEGNTDMLETAVLLLQQLQENLIKLYTYDLGFLTAAMKHVAEAANYLGLSEASKELYEADDVMLKARLAFGLLRFSGNESTITYEYLVESLLSSRMDADVLALNPFLNSEQISRVVDMTMVSLFHANRAGLARRCVTLTQDLVQLLQNVHSSISRKDPIDVVTLSQEIHTRSEFLAQTLTSKRYYVRKAPSAGNEPIVELDPRFLVFEFAQNITLRKSQVEMVNLFIQKLGRETAGGPVEPSALCQQMIMGSGKTT
jgi:hypothetical protein